MTLEVSAGPDAGTSVSSSAEKLTIGSAPGNDLVLSDATVSRCHAELVRERGGYRVKDLGSTNGTRVDHVRVQDAYVADGSTLAFGATTVRFSLGATPDVLPLHPEPRFGKLVGESAVMRALFAQLARLAATDATVLIEGESGTGKELVAEALHQASPRASGPFIVVDCGSIPAELHPAGPRDAAPALQPRLARQRARAAQLRRAQRGPLRRAGCLVRPGGQRAARGVRGPLVRVDLPYKEAKEAWLAHFEETYLRQRLAASGGNVSQMAREAEVDRAHVIKLRKHAVR